MQAAKDHGIKFRSKPAASFSGIVHCQVQSTPEVNLNDHIDSK